MNLNVMSVAGRQPLRVLSITESTHPFVAIKKCLEFGQFRWSHLRAMGGVDLKNELFTIYAHPVGHAQDYAHA
jgi:hypothetical protein